MRKLLVLIVLAINSYAYAETQGTAVAPTAPAANDYSTYQESAQNAAATDSGSIDEASIEKELTALANSKTNTNTEKAKTESSLNKTLAKENAKSEEEIPVLSQKADKKTSSVQSSGLRLTLGLFVLSMFLIAAWLGIQKWMRNRNLKNPQTSIKVMTTHYLGPKKSLAIINVAGESILIGITDSNITHIKTLSLLDGELPVQMPTHFSESLTAAEESDEDNVEDYAVKGVRDALSDRLKSMRNLW